MNTKKKLTRFMQQSPIHEMFVYQATQYYADSLLLNKNKLIEDNKNSVIHVPTLINIANEAKLLEVK